MTISDHQEGFFQDIFAWSNFCSIANIQRTDNNKKAESLLALPVQKTIKNFSIFQTHYK